jgi:predicted RNA-binding Zn-ribbon protein involved in translation (DUF1610 family)
MEKIIETCFNCKTIMEPSIERSNGKYYVGYWCPNCGPYDRISGYFATRAEAEKFLNEM